MRIKDCFKKLNIRSSILLPNWHQKFFTIILFLAAIGIVVSAVKSLQDDNLTVQIIVLDLSAIGLSIALASASFSYARVCDTDSKSEALSAGEHFLHAALLFVMVLLINWLLVEFIHFVKSQNIKSFGLFFDYLLLFLFLLAFLGLFSNAAFAVFNMVAGIDRLRKLLHSKTYPKEW